MLDAPSIDISGIHFVDRVTGEPVSSSAVTGSTCTTSVTSSCIAEGEYRHLDAVGLRDLTGAVRSYVLKQNIPCKYEYAHAPPLRGLAKAIYDEQRLETT